MTEDDSDGVPDADPRHIDPAGDLADLVEEGEIEIELAEDQDRADLRGFLARVEAGEHGADPGLEAVVRIVRAILDEGDSEE